MEGDLDSLALSPPPGLGLLSELVHHVRQEGAQVIMVTVPDHQTVHKLDQRSESLLDLLDGNVEVCHPGLLFFLLRRLLDYFFLKTQI